MSIMDFIEEAAGPPAAGKALNAVDPGAGLLAKAAAAVGGVVRVSAPKHGLLCNTGDAAEAPADQDGLEPVAENPVEESTPPNQADQR